MLSTVYMTCASVFLTWIKIVSLSEYFSERSKKMFLRFVYTSMVFLFLSISLIVLLRNLIVADEAPGYLILYLVLGVFIILQIILVIASGSRVLSIMRSGLSSSSLKSDLLRKIVVEASNHSPDNPVGRSAVLRWNDHLSQFVCEQHLLGHFHCH